MGFAVHAAFREYRRRYARAARLVLNICYYSVPDRGAEYCDERVCLSLCLSVRDHIFVTKRP